MSYDNKKKQNTNYNNDKSEGAALKEEGTMLESKDKNNTEPTEQKIVKVDEPISSTMMQVDLKDDTSRIKEAAVRTLAIYDTESLDRGYRLPEAVIALVTLVLQTDTIAGYKEIYKFIIDNSSGDKLFRPGGEYISKQSTALEISRVSMFVAVFQKLNSKDAIDLHSLSNVFVNVPKFFNFIDAKKKTN